MPAGIGQVGNIASSQRVESLSPSKKRVRAAEARAPFCLTMPRSPGYTVIAVRVKFLELAPPNTTQLILLLGGPA